MDGLVLGTLQSAGLNLEDSVDVGHILERERLPAETLWVTVSDAHVRFEVHGSWVLPRKPDDQGRPAEAGFTQ